MTHARIDLRVLREGPDAEPKPATIPSQLGEFPRYHDTGVAPPERGRAAAAPACRRARSLLARVLGRRAS